jgi:hypothetical protein
MLEMQINRLDSSKINSKIVVTLIKNNGKKIKTQRRDIAFKLKMTDDTIYKYQAILVGLSAIKDVNQSIRISMLGFESNDLYGASNDKQLYFDELKRRIIKICQRHNNVFFDANMVALDNDYVNKIKKYLVSQSEYHDTGTVLIDKSKV